MDERKRPRIDVDQSLYGSCLVQRHVSVSMAAFPWPRSHATEMFVVSEAEISAIRTAFDQGGEFAAAVQLRRLFPGVTDNVGHSRRTTWGHTVAARGQQMFCQPAAAKTLVSVCVRKDWVLQSCAHLTMHG